MAYHWTRVAFALIAPLLLASCFVTPGKFVSTLNINADRSFTYTYQGEVTVLDLGKEFAKGMAEAGKKDDDAGNSAQDNTAKMEAVAAALRKETGYRSVEYKGDGLFLIDYAITSRLTHNFIYPFNIDAEILFPFIAIELRGKDQVRVKAPAFADQGTEKRMGRMGKTKGKHAPMDGTFTLTTNAQILSQNTETGAQEEGDEQVMRWKATPLTKDAPMAVLKLDSLP